MRNKVLAALFLALSLAGVAHADKRVGCPTAAPNGLCVLYNGPWAGAFDNYIVGTPVGTAPALWVISFSTTATVNAQLAATPDAQVTNYTGNAVFWFQDVTCASFGVSSGVALCKGNQFTLAQEAVLVSGSGGSGNVELVLQFAPLTAPTLLALNNNWLGTNSFFGNVNFSGGTVTFNNGFSVPTGIASVNHLTVTNLFDGAFTFNGTEKLGSGVICLDTSCNQWLGGGTHPDGITINSGTFVLQNSSGTTYLRVCPSCVFTSQTGWFAVDVANFFGGTGDTYLGQGASGNVFFSSQNGTFFFNGAHSWTAQINGLYSHAGDGGGFAGNIFNFSWNSPCVWFYVDVTLVNNTSVCASDARVKTNIQQLGSAMPQIMALQPVTFNYIQQTGDVNLATMPLSGPDSVAQAQLHTGFIAQQVKSVIPTAVPGNADSSQLLTISSMDLIAYLVKAVQELNQQIGLLCTAVPTANCPVLQ